MSIGLRLDLRQSQQLVMTPQLQQAIKLLQMSNMELSDFVDGEVEKNPLLRVESNEGDSSSSPETEPSEAVASPEGPADTDSRSEDHSLTGDTFDTGSEHLHDTAPSDGPSPIGDGHSSCGTGSGGHDSLPGLEERLAERPSLREHLRTQLGQQAGAGLAPLIARHLVEELDEHGMLRADLEDVAERLNVSREGVDAGLSLLQSCDPTGVGARDLTECLALQLQERDRLDPAMKALIDHLDLLATGEIKRLKASCGVSDEDFSDMVREIRALNPRPCAGFEIVEPETLIPDILLKRTDWGGWHIELNSDTLPRVLIDRTYVNEIGKHGCKDARKFLTDCQSTASWLIKSLDQRAKTIVKIASEIVQQQERFFNEGISGLRPLTLRDVADAVGMHESTASRVTANKYIATERGIFELKFFFTNSVGGGEGDMTAEAVRHRIKAMVDSECPKKILSDDAIVEALNTEGIDIARRTVAKYRKSLSILSSVDRRRMKAANAAL